MFLIDTGLFKRNVWARGCLFKRLIAENIKNKLLKSNLYYIIEIATL